MKDRRVFIDTNIFVYAMQHGEKDKQKKLIAKNFLETLDDEVIISTQVLNEFGNVLIKNKIDDLTIRNLVDAIVEECILVCSIDLKMVNKAWDIKIRYNFSYWDSLIISAALLSGCSIIYSEDLQHNQIIENQLKVINPLNVHD